MDLKRALRKTWYFLWEDDSPLSWVVNVILAFVIIKFIVYPALGWMLGTGFPIVAVISSSMEHDGNFDTWWNTRCPSAGMSQGEIYLGYSINQERFKEFPFKNGFNKGDIMVLSGAKDPEIGDILVFYSPDSPEPVIHRIVQVTNRGDGKYYTTKGDHNCISSMNEKDISQARIFGKARLRIPLLGWVKIAFVELLKVIGVI